MTWNSVQIVQKYWWYHKQKFTFICVLKSNIGEIMYVMAKRYMNLTIELYTMVLLQISDWVDILCFPQFSLVWHLILDMIFNVGNEDMRCDMIDVAIYHIRYGIWEEVPHIGWFYSFLPGSAADWDLIFEFWQSGFLLGDFELHWILFLFIPWLDWDYIFIFGNFYIYILMQGAFSVYSLFVRLVWIWHCGYRRY